MPLPLLESSIHAFRLTLEKLVGRIEGTLQTLQLQNEQTYSEQNDDTIELDDEQLEAITVGSDKVQIQLNDIDALKWAGDLRADLATLQDLLHQATQIEVAMESNSLAPYILLYVTDEGEAFIHYTHAKKILDAYRKLALGKQKPDVKAVQWFEVQTNDATDMGHYQELLKQSIHIIKDKQEEVGFESLFTFGANTLQAQLDLGIDEIELISFLVVKDEAI